MQAFVLLRITKMVVAYLAASLAAGCVIAMALTIGTSTAWSSESTTLPVRGLVAGILVALLAALPSAAIIYHAEVRRRRAAGFYAGAGALTGAITAFGWVLLLSGLTPQGWQWPNAQGLVTLVILIAVCAAAGIVGGLTYWAIAGRSAGSPGGASGEVSAHPQSASGTHSSSTAA